MMEVWNRAVTRSDLVQGDHIYVFYPDGSTHHGKTTHTRTSTEHKLLITRAIVSSLFEEHVAEERLA